MKKALLAFVLTCFGAALFAQSSLMSRQTQDLQRNDVPGMVAKPAVTHSQSTHSHMRSEVLWSDDFSDPTTWVFTNTSTSPYDWEITTDPSAMPNAAATLFPFASSTASNGYALIDSDGSPFQGDGNGQIQAEIRTASAIDLSGQDVVWLTFQHNYRWWQDTRGVRLSGDNGATWTDFVITNNDGFPNEQNTANPEIERFNVSDIVAGQSEVLIEFFYDDNNFWGWYWVVDDVSLFVPVDYDIELSTAYFGNSILTDLAAETLQDIETWDDYAYQLNMEYTHYPVGQVRPMNFVGFATNFGLETLTNVRLSATVLTPSGVEGPFLSPMGVTVEAEEQVVLTIDNVVLSAFVNGGEVGEYEVMFEVISDQEDENPENNFAPSKLFNVTTDEFANDDPNNSANDFPITSNRTVGTRYAFVEPTTITHIKFALYNSATIPTLEGELCYPNVRAASVIQPAGANNPATPIFNETAMEYVVEMDEVNQGPLSGELNYIVLELPSEVEASNDRVYQAEISFPQTVDGDVIALLSQNNRETFAGVQYIVGNESTYGQGWFSLGGESPIIRFGTLGVVSTRGVDQLKVNMSQNYPNPSYGQTTIDWELMEPGKNVRFALTDMTGRTVYAKDLGDRPAGKQEPLILDLSRFAAGNYQYGITVGNERLVKKMVIVK